MTPQQTLKETTRYLKNLNDAKTQVVKVGLPQQKVGGKVYPNDLTVIRNATFHEYGLGNNPQRSFLRTPFILKKRDMNETITGQFRLVIGNGLPVKTALGRIGVKATNISKGAFTTKGYGKWKASKKAKGQTLIRTAVLRNSLTWVIANAT